MQLIPSIQENNIKHMRVPGSNRQKQKIPNSLWHHLKRAKALMPFSTRRRSVDFPTLIKIRHYSAYV